MKKKCFVLMPFAPEFKNQWDKAIVPAINDVGLEPYRGDAESLGTNMIMRDVTKSIAEAEVIVADLTGRNPNVMYELGLCHAAKKNVVMLAQDDEDIPFDLRHIRHLKYNPLDLLGFQVELSRRIDSTILQNDNDRHDFFPELSIMGIAERKELAYLRQTTTPVKIDVKPPTADIFFNDEYIGSGNRTLFVNPNARRNTVSISGIEHFEHHQEITKDELGKGSINIILAPRTSLGSDFQARFAGWLRKRRKDPNNPVLMKAISQYLLMNGAVDEALEEVKELLEFAPNWYGAYSNACYVYIALGRYEEALQQAHKVIAFKPNHAQGYLMLACLSSVTNDFKTTIDQLEKILSSEILLETYSHYGSWTLNSDHDFDPIKSSSEYCEQFNALVSKIESYNKAN